MKKLSNAVVLIVCLTIFRVYSAPTKKRTEIATPAQSTTVTPVAAAEKVADDLPDITLYHVSYLGSLINSGKRTINILNGETLSREFALSYNGVIGIEKRIFRGLGGFGEYGFSQRLMETRYSTPGANYWLTNVYEGNKAIAMRTETNFRLVAGLFYTSRFRKYLILQAGVGYINVHQLTYEENRASSPLTITPSGSVFLISHDPKTDAIKTDATFHGIALTANFIFTPFEVVHFPFSIRYNTIFTPSKFSENAQLPSSVQELWIGTGVRLNI